MLDNSEKNILFHPPVNAGAGEHDSIHIFHSAQWAHRRTTHCSSVCGEACLNHGYCEKRNRMFSCRLLSLLMLTWGQNASQPESGNFRWESVTLASATQTHGLDWCEDAKDDGSVSVLNIRQRKNTSESTPVHVSVICRFLHRSLEKHFSGLILCVWAYSIYPSERHCTHSVTHLGAGQLRAHTPPNLHAPRSRENGYS